MNFFSKENHDQFESRNFLICDGSDSDGCLYTRNLKFRVLENSGLGVHEKSRVWPGKGIRIRVLDILLF